MAIQEEQVYTPANPILAVVAGSGQVARSAAESGADMLIALNAGVYRNLGQGSLPAFLPFGNANAQTLRLLREHILPVSGKLPVVAGAQCGDPRHDLDDLFSEYRALGVYGVANWPAAGFLDGHLRAALEAAGRGLQSEIDMLRRAQASGLKAFGFVFTPQEARAFAAAGVDTLILHLGLTRQPEGVHAMRDMLQLNRAALVAMLEAAAVKPPSAQAPQGRPPCLAFGGTVTEPDDLDELLRYCPLEGFAGGSVFERLPVDGILGSTVRRFKGVLVRPAAERLDAASVASALATAAKKGSGMGPMLGASQAMDTLFRTIRKVAPFDVSVCIEGETGTGKELVAIQMHQGNRRASHAFVTVNCGAMPDSLLESELFGHEKGAFTGADRRRLGKFELAHHGTLFLDEIADLSAHGQVALLRALQQREITRVGGERPIPVDVRIIAASNQSLIRLVEAGRFRADLYHRLNNVTLFVPPLRERLGDLPALVEDILARLQVQLGRRISGVTQRFMIKMRQHAWPGNVRELQHVLTQAALLEDGLVLEGSGFTPSGAGWGPNMGPQYGAGLGTGAGPHSGAAVNASWGLEPAAQTHPAHPTHPVTSPIAPLYSRFEAAQKAVAAAGGNKSRAAQALGVTRKTLYAWLSGSE
jgi:DNA-binding NtrC family response regulator/predicted TIM-barrel enzyme